MEKAPGVLPHPGRVPEQRLLSLEIHRRRRQSYGTLSVKLPTPLGFSIPRLYIGEGALSGGRQGLLTLGWCGQGLGRATYVWRRPLAPFGSLSVFGKLPEEIRLLELVSSNSKNISCVVFLKHKNSRKQGTGTIASCQ
jgi:hypothetical protein